MKLFKLITFFALFLLCNALEAQTFIYSYTDPCTGLIKSMNVPSNGVTVTYFGQIQTFDPQDFQTGVFDTWAEGVYNSFGGANPCGSIFGVSTSIDIAQSTAINFISIINNISALADLQSAMSGGGSLNTMSAIESAKNSSNKKDKKDKKKNQTTTNDNSSQNTTTNQSTSNNESNTEGSQNQNSNQSNQSGTTNTGSDQNVQSGQTNGSTNTENGQNTTSGNGQNQSGGENNPTNSNQNTISQNSQSGTENNQTNSNSQNVNSSQNGGQNTGGSTTTSENSQSTEGGPVNSTGQLNQTLTQSTDIGSGSGSGSNQNQTTQNSQTTTNGENSTTTTEQPNTQSGTEQSNTQLGTENNQSTNTTTENNSQNTNSGEPNSETGQNAQTTTSENSQNQPQNENGQTGETSSTNSEAGQTPNGENPQTTQNDPSQNGQSSNSSNSSNGNGGNGVGGESPNSNDNAAQNSEDKKTNFLGGTVKSVERSTESNKPQIVLSSDFAGFNFRSGEVDFGGKGTAGYTSLSWDGRRTYGVLLDYTSIIRGPNVTGFFANIAKKRIDLISLTGTFSFYGRGSQYGSLAIGQMWNLNKKKSLKAIYMATASFGNVYGEQFLGTAFIAGGMYDWRVHKRVDIKLMNLFIYAPYVSYYNDILLKSPYVIMPIVGTNIGITKKFKFNLNFGGAYAINENVMNFTLMFGTRFAL